MKINTFILLLFPFCIFAQLVPSKIENVEYLVTFSKEADDKWGDDDHVQINFFAIPKKEKNPIYIRIFDPNIGGKHDQRNKKYNSTTKFSVYGGNGAYSDKRSRLVDPVGKFRTGVLLKSKIFGNENIYDDNWYTFGPFNPQEGEYDKDLDAYVFKVIAEGGNGDDGNMYRYFLSSSKDDNKEIEGGNSFTYEMTIRLKNDLKEVAHFYPFINDQIIALQQHNFDFDNNGFIRLTSVVKKSHEMSTSGDGKWNISDHKISQKEHNTSLDIHIINKKEFKNDMTIYLLDQYKNAIPFFSIPIGGIPKYKYKIDVQYRF